MHLWVFAETQKKSGVSYDWQNCSLLCFATGAGAGAGAGASAWPGLIFQWLIIMIWATIQDVFCERKCSLFEIWPWLWQQPQWKSGIWAFWHASRAEQWSQGLWIIPRAPGSSPRKSVPTLQSVPQQRIQFRVKLCLLFQHVEEQLVLSGTVDLSLLESPLQHLYLRFLLSSLQTLKACSQDECQVC